MCSLLSLPRVALIGVTGYAGIYLNHVRGLLARGEIVLVAAVIVNAREVPDIVNELRASDVLIYETADEFFAQQAGKVDLCLIPVGIQWHARLTISALESGMNVLVEKPLAGSLDDVLAIRAAEGKTGRWVAVGFQDIYSSDSAWLKRKLLDGVIGKLEEVRMIGLWPRTQSYFSRNHWAGRLRADGADVCDSPLNNAFAHFVNLALFFAGEKTHESATCEIEFAELLRAHNIETFDTAVVQGSSSAGVKFWFGVSHSTDVTRQPELRLRGSRGTVDWFHSDRCVITINGAVQQVFKLSSEEDSRRLMFQSVLQRLELVETAVCSTEIAEAHARLIASVHRTGEIRKFPTDLVRWIADAQGRPQSPVVEGLDARLQQAMDLSSSLGFDRDSPAFDPMRTTRLAASGLAAPVNLA